MGLDYGLHVSHGTVTDFDSISIEETPEGMIPVDECVHEFKEALCNVGCDTCIEGWVEPHYVAFPSTFTLACGFLVGIGPASRSRDFARFCGLGTSAGWFPC